MPDVRITSCLKDGSASVFYHQFFSRRNSAPARANLVHRDEIGLPTFTHTAAPAMPLAERQRRYEASIATVRDDNVKRWTEDFVTDLAGTATA